MVQIYVASAFSKGISDKDGKHVDHYFCIYHWNRMIFMVK